MNFCRKLGSSGYVSKYDSITKLPVETILLVLYISKPLETFASATFDEQTDFSGLTKVLVSQLQERHSWIFPKSLQTKHYIQEVVIPEYVESCKRIIERSDELVQAKCDQLVRQLEGKDEDVHMMTLLENHIRQIARS